MAANTDDHQKELTLAELLDTSFVRCEYCTNVFTSPLLLPCLHTFCEQCVAEMAVKQNVEMLQSRKGQNHHPTDKNKHPESRSDKKENVSEKRTMVKSPVTTSGGQQINNCKDILFTMNCPTCKSVITFDSDKLDTTTTSISDEDDKDGDTEKKPTHNKDNKDNKDQEKSDDNKTKAPGIPVAVFNLMKNAIRRSLPVNCFLDSVTRLYRHKNDASRECAYCKTEDVIADASSLCLQCGDDVCEGCANAHRKTRVTRDHSVVSYSAIQQGLFDHDIRKAGSVQCQDHPEADVTHFCHDCMKVVCKPCLSKSHFGHTAHHLKEATAKLAPDIGNVQQGLSRRIPDLTRYIDFLSEQLDSLLRRHTRAVDDINTQTELIHRMVDEWRAKVMSTVESATSQERKSIEDKIDNIKTSKTSMEKSAVFLLNLSNLGKPDEKMALYASVMQRYQQLLRTKPKAMVSRLGISFAPGPTTEQNIRMLIGKMGLRREELSKKDAPKSRLPISSLMPAILDPPVLVKSWTISTPEPQTSKETTRLNNNKNNNNNINSAHHQQDNRYISGVDIKGNMMAAVDRENAKVIIVDIANQNVLKEITGNGADKLRKPFDVVFLPSGALAVTDPEASVVKVFDWTGKFIFNFERGEEGAAAAAGAQSRTGRGQSSRLTHPRGITLNLKGEVVVVDGHLRHCTVHDSNTGKILRTVTPYREEAKQHTEHEHHLANLGEIEKSTDGKKSLKKSDTTQALERAVTPNASAVPKATESSPIFVDPFYVSTTPEDNLVITDAASPNVKILRPDGLVLDESMDYGTRTEESLHPAGVCVDKSGYILLADTYNCRIQLGLPDGQFSDTLLSSKSDSDLSHPISVCLDQDGHAVVVQVEGKINVYKYL